MKKGRFVSCRCIFFLMVILFFCTQSVFAAQRLLASLGGGAAAGADDGGAIVWIDQSTGAATVLATPMPGYGLPGLAADSNGRVFAVTSWGSDGVTDPKLIEINPLTGALIEVVGDLTYEDEPIAIHDISFQPGTDILFGSATDGTDVLINSLMTIDTSTAEVSLVGTPVYAGVGSFVAIAFAPDGTLWAKEANGSGLWTVNPATAAIITSTTISPAIGSIGLGVRPSDGILFLSECCPQAGTDPTDIGNDIYTLNTSTGSAVYIGDAGGTRRVHDFAFVNTSDAAIPTVNEWGMIVISLMLAGSAVWFLRRRRAEVVNQ